MIPRRSADPPTLPLRCVAVLCFGLALAASLGALFAGIAQATDIPPRYWHSMILDPVRDRLIVFGGYSPTILSDLWELPLSGPPVWHPMEASGGPPAGRCLHAAVYDPVRDRMLIYGGSNASAIQYPELWELRLSPTPEWRLIATDGVLPAAIGIPMVYDSQRDRLVVVSPEGTRVLALTGSTWTRIADAPRFESTTEAQIVYDAEHDELLAYASHYSLGRATWRFDGSAWVRVEYVPPPYDDFGFSAVFDPIGRRVIVFGGGRTIGRTTQRLSETRSFDDHAPSFQILAPLGVLPDPRSGHAAVYDALRQRMIVFGGRLRTAMENDLWALSLSPTETPRWTALDDTPTPTLLERFGAEATTDGVRIHWRLAPGGATESAWIERAEGGASWLRLEGNPIVAGEDRELVDRSVATGRSYDYRLAARDHEGVVVTFAPVRVLVDAPSRETVLSPPLPNPSRAAIRFEVALARASRLRVRVLDAQGRCVATVIDRHTAAGRHALRWDGAGDRGRSASGVYHLVLETDGIVRTRRFALVH